MRILRLPHAWTGVLACFICVVSMGLFVAGCGGDAASEKPVSELDRAFPEGRPGISGVEERMADTVYREKISAALDGLAVLNGELRAAQDAVQKHADAVAASMRAENPEVTEEAIAAALAADSAYLGLGENVKAAEAKIEAAYEANRAMIREKAFARQREYDALKARLDTASEAASEPAAE